jgi:hypothetical protein
VDLPKPCGHYACGIILATVLVAVVIAPFKFNLRNLLTFLPLVHTEEVIWRMESPPGRAGLGRDPVVPARLGRGTARGTQRR